MMKWDNMFGHREGGILHGRTGGNETWCVKVAISREIERFSLGRQAVYTSADPAKAIATFETSYRQEFSRKSL